MPTPQHRWDTSGQTISAHNTEHRLKDSISGASVYPGGMVTLGPGYNAATAIAEDLGIKPWWNPSPLIVTAREKGLIPKE